MQRRAAKILTGSFEPQPRRLRSDEEPERDRPVGKIIPGEFFRNKPEPMAWIMLGACASFTVVLLLTITGILPIR